MKILAFISLVLLCEVSVGQASFSTDDHGKYIHYEIVELKGVGKDSLISRAKFFFKNLNKNSAQVQAASDSVLTATGKFIISNTTAMLSHPSGEVSYRFRTEVKDGKYRYWLTDFKFTPYQRDRYGVFVPVAGASTPLEKSPGKLNAAVWKDYVQDALDQTAKFSQKFKEQMATPLRSKRAEKPAGTISPGKW